MRPIRGEKPNSRTYDRKVCALPRDRVATRTSDCPRALRDAIAAARPSPEAEAFNDELD